MNVQYADDTVIFGECDITQAEILKWGLYLFEEWSGSKVNYNKSSITLLGESGETGNTIANLLNCSIQKLPIKYLGLLIGSGSIRRGDWHGIIDKIANMLEGWKGKMLSFRGRLILLNSVVSSIPLYFMSFFQIPVWVVKKIDRLRRRFLWHGAGDGTGYALIKWGIVCRRKEFGGLGVVNLCQMNQALLCKWWWKLKTKTKLCYANGFVQVILISTKASSRIRPDPTRHDRNE